MENIGFSIAELTQNEIFNVNGAQPATPISAQPANPLLNSFWCTVATGVAAVSANMTSNPLYTGTYIAANALFAVAIAMYPPGAIVTAFAGAAIGASLYFVFYGNDNDNPLKQAFCSYLPGCC